MADEELRDVIAAFLRTHIRLDSKPSQEAQEEFEKAVDRRVNGDIGKSIRLYREEHGRYPGISEIQELVNQQSLARQEVLKRQREQFVASEYMANKEIRARVREVLMNAGFLSGEAFERWAKEILEGGVTREELIERVVDAALPSMGSQLKAFHDEHGCYPDLSPRPGEWRVYGPNEKV